MIIRLVRITLRPGTLKEFLAHFDDAAPRIRGYPGCKHLELWQGTDDPNLVYTYSEWVSEEALRYYRRSKLFRTTWKAVKPLFSERAEAISIRSIRVHE